MHTHEIIASNRHKDRILVGLLGPSLVVEDAGLLVLLRGSAVRSALYAAAEYLSVLARGDAVSAGDALRTGFLDSGLASSRRRTYHPGHAYVPREDRARIDVARSGGRAAGNDAEPAIEASGHHARRG